jgi:hypothetical protein
MANAAASAGERAVNYIEDIESGDEDMMEAGGAAGVMSDAADRMEEREFEPRMLPPLQTRMN